MRPLALTFLALPAALAQSGGAQSPSVQLSVVQSTTAQSTTVQPSAVLSSGPQSTTAQSAAAQSRIPNNGLGTAPAYRQVISQTQATAVLNAAVQIASAAVLTENVAIVDPYGFLVAFTRMDNAYPGSVEIAIKKARTVVLFNGFTTEAFGEQVQSQQGITDTNGGLIAFGGGVPIYSKGSLIGAIGVSGGTVNQDMYVAGLAVTNAQFDTTQ